MLTISVVSQSRTERERMRVADRAERARTECAATSTSANQLTPRSVHTVQQTPSGALALLALAMAGIKTQTGHGRASRIGILQCNDICWTIW